jgi:signal transduction histidine kinase
MTVDIAHGEVSRHKCLIYDGHPSEQLSVVVPLIMDGLRDKWRCLYLGSADDIAMVESALAEHGVDIAIETARGALVFSTDRSHLEGGGFDAVRMVDGLNTLIDAALADGFGGLCATGDMRWEIGSDENFEHLLDYEARLDQVIRDRPLRGICQYHRETVPAKAVREALMTHRSTFIGDALNRDNLFYIPPDVLLHRNSGRSRERQGEWMYQQIIRVMQAEDTRDKALVALQASEAHQRNLAEQLAEMNRDLERRVVERTAELEAANAQLEAFSYSVSHDLSAPLRRIGGFSAVLADEHRAALDNDGRELLERIKSGVVRMHELIDGMLALSKVVKGDLRREPVNLSALADEIARDIRASAPGRSAEIIIHDGLNANGDRTLLRAALENLIGNAWKFTSKRPMARIEVGRRGDEDGKPVFFVRDNGAGFDSSRAQRLFGAFQRLHDATDFPGTGVGLATVQRIVTRHGGRIWAEATPGEGAAFFFTLPA